MSEIKNDLIKIATKTIQKSGVNKLTIRELGDAVNIKSSSVMYHFKSKDGLLNELVKVYNENFFQHLEEINLEFTEPKERLIKLVTLFESVLEEGKLCLCAMMASEGDNLDGVSKEYIKMFFIDLDKWIEKNLQLLKLDNNLSKVILSSLEGAMLVDKIESKNTRLNAVKLWIKSL